MIVDERVLTASFQPKEILHRHDEIETLSTTLQPLADGHIDSSAGAFIWGPTGTGKTCTTQYLLDQLSETADVNTQFINCWKCQSAPDVYHSLINTLNPSRSRTHGSVAVSVLWDTLTDSLDQQFVVVLDEVDQLADQKVLYQFFEHPLFTPILIANRNNEFFSKLDRRVASRVRTYPTIAFRPYSISELTAILQRRARAALEPGVVSDLVFEEISTEVAGDARQAIATLRKAVDRADESVQVDDVQAAVIAAKGELRQSTLENLTYEQLLLYTFLEEYGEQSIGDLFDHYKNRVDEPKTKRTIRNHIRKMVDYDLVRASGSKKGRTYRILQIETLEA